VNLRLDGYAALMSALLGGLFGWTMASIGQPDTGRPRCESALHRSLYSRYPVIGAGLGSRQQIPQGAIEGHIRYQAKGLPLLMNLGFDAPEPSGEGGHGGLQAGEPVVGGKGGHRALHRSCSVR
jgi:hypothetical protein